MGNIKKHPMVNLRSKLKIFIFILLFTNICFSQEEASIQDSINTTEKIEARTVTIKTKVRVVDVSPTAYRISYYPRTRQAEPYITKMFFPGEKMEVVIPEDILNPDSLGNVVRLEPLGGEYEVQYRMFNKAKDTIDLHPFLVTYVSDIIKLNIIDGATGNPVSFGKIEVTQSGKLLTQTIADSMGYTRVRVPVYRNIENEIVMSINTNGLFPTWTDSFILPRGLSEKTVNLSRLTLLKGESIYSVVTDHVPFRQGPENASEVLFFLNEGEQLAVSKVAGDRLFGRVRIYLEKQKTYHYFSGWILAKNVYLQ